MCWIWWLITALNFQPHLEAFTQGTAGSTIICMIALWLFLFYSTESQIGKEMCCLTSDLHPYLVIKFIFFFFLIWAFSQWGRYNVIFCLQCGIICFQMSEEQRVLSQNVRASATSHVPVREQELHGMANQVHVQPSWTSALKPETFGTLVTE